MTYKYPESFARFYDIIYHRIRDGVDNDFFLGKAAEENGKILEVGSGTGRLFIDALKNGADIYGIDISESMLKILKGKLADKDQSRVTCQSITDFCFSFRFGLIIAPFRVMMHLLEKEEQLRALNNIYDHLAPSGRFIFDVFVPDLKQIQNGMDNELDFNGEYEKGKALRRFVSTEPDLIRQMIEVHFRLEWEETGMLKKEEWTLPLRFYFRYELEHLLERSRFSKYNIYGDYHLNEPSKSSKDFVVICQK